MPSPGQASRGRQLQRRGVQRVRRAAEIGDLGGITPLEAKTVAVKTRKGYQREVELWSAWSSEHGQEVNDPAALDLSLLFYLNFLFSLGWHVCRGEKLMAGVWHFFPESGKYGSIQTPRSMRALKGWRRATPRHSRLPFPWQVWAALSLEALRDGLVRLAFGLLLAVEAYLRPSELLGVRCGDFIGPAPGGVTAWGLPLHPSARNERSEVGSQDDTIPLDPRSFADFAPLVDALSCRPSEELLVGMDYRQFLELFNRYCRRLKVKAQPYAAKHSGARVDRATNVRPPVDVKKRGRWTRMASVIRCDKTGRVNDSWRARDSEVKAYCLEAARRLLGCLLAGDAVPHHLA